MHGPLELLFLEPFEPRAEPAALPIQNLDLIAPLIDEAEQIAAERIEPQHRLDHRRQPVDAEPEINRVLRHIDCVVAIRRRSHRRGTLARTAAHVLLRCWLSQPRSPPVFRGAC
jgi:hypothetical protein